MKIVYPVNRCFFDKYIMKGECQYGYYKKDKNVIRKN